MLLQAVFDKKIDGSPRQDLRARALTSPPLEDFSAIPQSSTRTDTLPYGYRQYRGALIEPKPASAAQGLESRIDGAAWAHVDLLGSSELHPARRLGRQLLERTSSIGSEGRDGGSGNSVEKLDASKQDLARLCRSVPRRLRP